MQRECATCAQKERFIKPMLCLRAIGQKDTVFYLGTYKNDRKTFKHLIFVFSYLQNFHCIIIVYVLISILWSKMEEAKNPLQLQLNLLSWMNLWYFCLFYLRNSHLFVVYFDQHWGAAPLNPCQHCMSWNVTTKTFTIHRWVWNLPCKFIFY